MISLLILFVFSLNVIKNGGYKNRMPEILAKNFIADSQFLNNASIEEDAVNIIKLCRDRKSERTQLDAFLSEYGLSNNEGGLMNLCHR